MWRVTVSLYDLSQQTSPFKGKVSFIKVAFFAIEMHTRFFLTKGLHEMAKADFYPKEYENVV